MDIEADKHTPRKDPSCSIKAGLASKQGQASGKLRACGVVESIEGCGPSDPGSIPGTPAIFHPPSARMMSRAVEVGFVPHPTVPHRWIWRHANQAMCHIVPNHDWTLIEITNVMVFHEAHRRQGQGRSMISRVTSFFPNAWFWVYTYVHSQPFWMCMHADGHVQEVVTPGWPCPWFDCSACLPHRPHAGWGCRW